MRAVRNWLTNTNALIHDFDYGFSRFLDVRELYHCHIGRQNRRQTNGDWNEVREAVILSQEIACECAYLP